MYTQVCGIWVCLNCTNYSLELVIQRNKILWNRTMGLGPISIPFTSGDGSLNQ